ncbi:O-methyltransferase [Intrasporangium sp.]|uniref:O-methyltransferase n=1 Tax=Intrasporangium sp. TaxID=1925024 RepID=UPI0033656FAC
MSDPAWEAVDSYISDLLVPEDDDLRAVHEANATAGLPAIDVAPNQGKLLHLLARLAGARAVLEIGTLGGYSTIWLARAVGPQGRVVTLEFAPHHAEVARANLERAGVADRVDVRVGRALDTLPTVESDGLGPFDLVFIDADKKSTADYVRWAVRLGRPGTVVILDNAIWDGAVADLDSADLDALGVRAGLEEMARNPRLEATAIQTVGVKGWDGFALAVVT